MIEFNKFKKEVEAAGLQAVDCGNYHWRIIGGLYEVNWYPRSKRKTIYINGLGRKATETNGDLAAAIRVAQQPSAIQPTDRRTKRKGSYGRLRTKLLKRDAKCFWCCAELTKSTATIDHKTPLVRGGSNAQDNTVLACEKCNGEKGNQVWEKKDGEVIKYRTG